MKKTAKIIALLLSLVMVIGVFAACSGDKDVANGGKFTYWVTFGAPFSETIQSFNELLMYQEMAKATGTEVEFIHPAAGSTGAEAFQILLSSGDYPDMIEYYWAQYSGGPQQAIDDGVIIALNDYMKDYAPNYYDYMEGEKGKANNYLYKAQSLSSEGNYFGFRNLSVGTYRGFSGFIVRKDMLDKWGIDIPTTIDDWTELFKTAKANGFKYPFTATSTFFSMDSGEQFNNAWDVGMWWYIDNNELKFGPFQNNFEGYIAQMRDWMKAGYIDVDIVTNDSTIVEGFMTNGTSVATWGWVGSGMGKLFPAMAEKDPNYDLVGCPFPVMKDGDIPHFQEVQAEANDVTLAISKQCGANDEGRYIEAIKWCDYLYSEEGLKTKCFGVEGDTYTIEKGEDGEDHFIYTDKIFDHEKIGAHSVEAALYHFMRPANGPGLNQHTDYLMGFYPYEQQVDALKTWNLYVEDAKPYKVPPLNYTADEAAKIAEIESKHNDNINAAISNAVLGKITIEDFKAEMDKAEKGGYDELAKIRQAAYDRYLKIIEESK